VSRATVRGPHWGKIETAMIKPDNKRKRHTGRGKCPLGYDKNLCPCEWENEKCTPTESHRKRQAQAPNP